MPKAATTRPDVDTIRQAMRGRGADILVSVGGLDRELLDGREHPCPKCGGDTRWRWHNDKEFGICHQCFETKNGDVLAAVQWLLGVDFLEAATKVGDYLGVKPLSKTKKKDPEADLQWLDWSAGSIPYLAHERPGITEEALLAFGAKRAKYKKNWVVFALPVYGADLDVNKPSGYVLLEAMGRKLPVWDRKGAVVDHVKIKTVAGTDAGFIGRHALERLAAPGLVEVAWKTEGVSDALTLWAAIPADQRDRHVVLTNAGGAQQTPAWMASVLAQAPRPLVLHDCDRPGQIGAEKWVQAIADRDRAATNVVLPYEVVEDHGEDVRDWLTRDKGTYEGLLKLAERGAVRNPGEKPTAATRLAEHVRILEKLRLEVLYETNDNDLMVFSTELKKSSLVTPRRLSETELLSIAGVPADDHVSADPDGVNTWSMQQVRKALSLVGAHRRGRHDERGVGVWRGLNMDGSYSDALVVANNTQAAVWNGQRELMVSDYPRVEGLTLDFGHADSEDWFSFELLEHYMAEAHRSREWRVEAVDRAVRLFQRWNWSNNPTAPSLVTGLVMATWVQTLWAWRPMVALIGDTNCGKSTLFETLGGEGEQLGLFGRLAMRTVKSSEAGVRQGLCNTARVPLLDEFEKAKDRELILQMIRASSRGDTIRKGTQNQRGQSFTMRHIFWVAATESGLRKQPDANRFIKLALLPAVEGEMGKLRAPASGEAVDLGQRLLAATLAVALEARQLAIDLKTLPFAGLSPRFVESLAVPAAILSSALGESREACEERLRGYLRPVAEDNPDEESDHEELLDTIMGSTVRTAHRGDRSVIQILEEHGTTTAEPPDQRLLEAHGVKMTLDGHVAIHCNTVARKLLRDTDFRGTMLKELLMRLEGAEHKNVRINAGILRCVVLRLPEKYLPSADAFEE